MGIVGLHLRSSGPPRPRWLTIPLPKITVGKQKASEAMTASTERRSSYNFAVKKMWSSTSEVLKLLLGAGSVVRRLPICKPFFPAAGLPCRNQSSRRSSQLIKQVAFDLPESDNRLCVAPRTELQASLQPSPPARSCPCHPQCRRSAIDHRTRPTPAPGGQLQEVWRLGIGIPGDFVGNLGLTTDRAGLAAPGHRPTKLWSIWGLVGRSVVHDHPERWLQYRLRCHAVERPSEVLGLVPTGRDQQVVSRRVHVRKLVGGDRRRIAIF